MFNSMHIYIIYIYIWEDDEVHIMVLFVGTLGESPAFDMILIAQGLGHNFNWNR